MQVLFEKNIEKKHLCHLDKNCCYFCKSNIPVISLIVGSRNVIKLLKNMVFGENGSCRLSNFLQIHIFWNFGHISRICNQINYRNIWFPKVIIILIMTAQVLFFNVFSKKDLHLNAVEVVNKMFILKILPEGFMTLTLALTGGERIVRIRSQRIVFPISSLTGGTLIEISMYAPWQDPEDG